MKQCKLCGTPLGDSPDTNELDKHWKKHHSWHWESNREKTPKEALLKNKIRDIFNKYLSRARNYLLEKQSLTFKNNIF